MDARLFYNQLLEEIASDEKALTDKKALANFFQQRLDAEERGADRNISSSAGIASGSASAAAVSRPTLTQSVIDAINDLGDKEFVVGDVYQWLQARRVAMPAQPKSKITTVLARFMASGALVRTFKGGGNVPNRYRRAAPMTNGAVGESTT